MQVKLFTRGGIEFFSYLLEPLIPLEIFQKRCGFQKSEFWAKIGFTKN